MKKIFFILWALVLFVIAPSFAATLTVPWSYATMQDAINAASSWDVVSLQNDVTITSQITISTDGISINGNGNSITANFVKTSNSNNSAIWVQADNVTISNIVLDGINPVVNQLHGINFYEASNGIVNNVTAKNFRSWILFNSSNNWFISNVKTEWNIWHGINVDTKTSQIATVSIAGVNTHNESTTPHMFIDDISDGTLITDVNNKYAFVNVWIWRAYYLDTTKPTATFIAPTLDKVFTGASVAVTVQANDDFQIKSTVINIKSSTGANIWTCYNSGSVLAPSLTANCTINISAYADGRYELRAGILDLAWNRLTTSTYFIVDKSKPTVAITTPTNGAAVKGTFAVTWTANDSISGIEKVLYTVTKINAIGGSYVANISDGMANWTGVWNFSMTWLTDGFYRLKVQAFDNWWNWRFVYHDVQVDNTKPVTTVDSPTDWSSFDADFTMNINSTDTGSAIVKVVANFYGSTGLIAPCTNQIINPAMVSVDFTCAVDVDTLTDGPYYVKTNAVDMAWNLSNTVTWNFTVDRTVEPVCGNWDTEAWEQCDDWNVTPMDGCSATCQTEDMWWWDEPVCGNWDTEAWEQCDDWNVTPMDGCSATCQTEDMWWWDEEEICTGTVSTDSPVTVPSMTTKWSPVTAVTFNSGDSITIVAPGTWAVGNDDPCSRTSDANGIDADHECFVQYGMHEGFPFGALLWSINGGAWFVVWTNYSFTAEAAWTLVLANNDSTFEDNTGELTVTITKTSVTEVECPYVPACGNGTWDTWEDTRCDGDSMMSEKSIAWYCNDSCQWVVNEYCGDGIQNNEGEQCDDGNENDTDSCSNDCTTNTPAPSGGWQASSIGGWSVWPSSLLETGPEDEQPTEEQKTEEQIATEKAINEAVEAACNEDTYILERLAKLVKQPKEVVYTVPSEYVAKYDMQITEAKVKLLAELAKATTDDERNDYIRTLVCDVETLKAERGLRHAHIWFMKEATNVADYILQYVQDIAILHFVK
jgi:cysteine-rich repeat protein